MGVKNYFDNRPWLIPFFILLALGLLFANYLESGEPFNEWLGSLFFRG